MAPLGTALAITVGLFAAAVVGTALDTRSGVGGFLLLGGVIAAVAGFLTSFDLRYVGVAVAGVVLWAGALGAFGEPEDGRGSRASGDDPEGALDPESILHEQPSRDFGDVGGMADLKATLRERVIRPLREPERYETYGVGTVDGLLLYGPPGCGKTHLAGALAGELGLDLVTATPSEITSRWIGQGADNVATAFETARENAPCVLFLDELDAIAGDRDDLGTTSQQQTLNQLLVELERTDDEVIVVGATNRLADIDGAVRRSGRFDERIEVPPPDAAAREEILTLALADRPTEDGPDLTATVEATAGYAASDVERVADLGARHAMADDAPVGEDHLAAAVEETTTSIPGWLDGPDADAERSVVQPAGANVPAAAALEEPRTTLADVPGMTDAVERLRDRVVDPVRNRTEYAAAGLEPLDGALLSGPDGTARERLARAVAGDLEVPLVRIDPATLNRWEDRPAAVLDDLVSIARANAPCVVHVADLDDLVPARDPQTGVTFADRLASHLGALREAEVLVLGTAASADGVDADVLGAGCFDERVRVDLPDGPTRAAVLRAALADVETDADLDPRAAAATLDGRTTGEIEQIAARAARRAVREDRAVTLEDIDAADDAGGEDLRYIE